jgi:hypothetical protein
VPFGIDVQAIPVSPAPASLEASLGWPPLLLPLLPPLLPSLEVSLPPASPPPWDELLLLPQP